MWSTHAVKLGTLIKNNLILGNMGLELSKLLGMGDLYARKGKKLLKSGCRKETVKLEFPDMVKSSK